MNAQTVFVPAVALVAGLALGYCLNSGSAAEQEPAAKKEKVARQISDAGDSDLVKSLRRQIRDLEKKLAEKPTEQSAEKTEEKVAGEESGRRRRGGPDWREMRERMEQWKKDNPEEFAKMEARRKEFMAQRAQKAQSKIDFLASIDTSRMSKKAKETHEQLQQQLTKREELMAKLQDENITDEERGQIFHDMHDVDRATRELGEQERENLLQQTAETLGFSGSEATEIVDTISEIYEATSGGHRGPGGPGGPGFGGPMGGPRGR